MNPDTVQKLQPYEIMWDDFPQKAYMTRNALWTKLPVFLLMVATIALFITKETPRLEDRTFLYFVIAAFLGYTFLIANIIQGLRKNQVEFAVGKKGFLAYKPQLWGVSYDLIPWSYIALIAPPRKHWSLGASHLYDITLTEQGKEYFERRKKESPVRWLHRQISQIAFPLLGSHSSADRDRIITAAQKYLTQNAPPHP